MKSSTTSAKIMAYLRSLQNSNCFVGNKLNLFRYFLFAQLKYVPILLITGKILVLIDPELFRVFSVHAIRTN